MIAILVGLIVLDVGVFIWMPAWLSQMLCIRTDVPDYATRATPELDLSGCRGRRNGIVWFGRGRTLYFRTQVLDPNEAVLGADDDFGEGGSFVPSFGRLKMGRDGQVRAWWFPALPITFGFALPVLLLIVGSGMLVNPVQLVGLLVFYVVALVMYAWFSHNIFDNKALPGAIAAINLYREDQAASLVRD
ncbi:MAG: hypothetical protein AAFV53_08360 [Myxococcota bacterium]